MRLLKTIPLLIFIAINLLMIVAMIFCVHTSCLPPQDYPEWSYWGLMFPVFLVVNVLFVLFWLIFKWKLVLLPLIGMAFCASNIRAYFPINFPSEPPTGSIKILSYNVMAFGEDKSKPWDENPIMRYLLESGADIICLQEARKTLVDEALDSISLIYPYYYYQLETDNYIACFSKFPIDSVTKIEYPTTTNHSYAYEMLVGEDTLLVINNHLESYKLSPEDRDDYKSILQNYKHPEQNDSETKYLGLTGKIVEHDSIRGYQVDSVAAFIVKNKGKHIVSCGDLNATPVSYVHHCLTKYLNDAYTRSGNGPGISFNRSWMYFRLDHIMVSPNVKAYSAKVDNSIKHSDHYPISCYVKLE
ncbi:MAG: endonuclease/exonuclease/phosphatase family protein [Bacteroidaceae bacterium]|nr:endonuclease/exonuclease/phosphatase family protein [Bacteroidaceae bacterium]